MVLRTSPSGPGFSGSHVHFGHMHLATSSPYTIVGSGAGPVEVPQNPPTVLYEPPIPTSLNSGFDLDASLSPIVRLRWTGQHDPNVPEILHGLDAIVFYYATLQMAAGGTALCEWSLARNGIQDETSKILIELSGNRPNYIMDTTLIRLEPGDKISPMVENVATAVEVQVYSAHISVSGSIEI